MIVNPTQPTSKFEILRRKNGQFNASAKYTSAYLAANGTNAVPGTETAVRGLGLGANVEANGTFDLAGPKNFIGHLTRRVTVGGLQLADRVFGVTTAVPAGVESPFPDGLEVSLEKGEEVELEGIGVYLASGAGALTTNTLPGTGLTYSSGLIKTCATDGSEIPFFTLTENNLTPVDAGALRIRMVAN